MVYDHVDAHDTSYMPMVESPLDEVDNELPAINFEQATVNFSCRLQLNSISFCLNFLVLEIFLISLKLQKH